MTTAFPRLGDTRQSLQNLQAVAHGTLSIPGRSRRILSTAAIRFPIQCMTRNPPLSCRAPCTGTIGCQLAAILDQRVIVGGIPATAHTHEGLIAGLPSLSATDSGGHCLCQSYLPACRMRR